VVAVPLPAESRLLLELIGEHRRVRRGLRARRPPPGQSRTPALRLAEAVHKVLIKSSSPDEPVNEPGRVGKRSIHTQFHGGQYETLGKNCHWRVSGCGSASKWDPIQDTGLPQVLGCKRQWGYFRACSLTGGGRVAWVLRLVKIDAEGEGQATDVMEIERPGDLADIADLGLTLAETKRLLAGLQQEIVAAQARDHAVRRPACEQDHASGWDCNR
jgi:hypothetical protein